MANTITGKIWSLDTVAGFVTNNNLCIHSIRVRFTTAGAGALVINSAPPEGKNVETLLDLKTTTASTAAAYMLDQQFFFGEQTFQGISKVTCTNVDSIYIVTGVQH